MVCFHPQGEKQTIRIVLKQKAKQVKWIYGLFYRYYFDREQ